MKKILIAFAFAGITIRVFAAELAHPKKVFVADFFKVIPVMANNPGLHGASFRTRVEILNPTQFSYPIKVTLYNSGELDQVTINMAAGQMRNYDNFLQEVFTYSGAGAVKFDSRTGPEGGSPDYQFLVTAEVYTDSPSGRYITPVETFDTQNQVLESDNAYSLGISVDSRFRTNIGAFNDSSGTNLVSADVYDSNGSLVNTVTLTLNANSWAQVPVPFDVSGGYIKWRPSSPAYCYAVLVHNTSNDGTFIPASLYIP